MLEIRSCRQAKVTRPAIADNSPFAVGLSCQDNEIFAAFLPALADYIGNEHFAAARFISNIADDVHTNRIEFHLSKTCIECSEEKFANRGRSAHGRVVGTKDDCIRSVGADEVVQVAAVAGKSPVECHLADGCLNTAHEGATARSAQLGGGGIVRDRARNGSSSYVLTRREIMMVIVMVIMMLAGWQGGLLGSVVGC